MRIIQFCKLVASNHEHLHHCRYVSGAADALLNSLVDYEKLGLPKQTPKAADHAFQMARMEQLLERLGNPQDQFKAVQIAGTKGKGSVAAMVASILRHSQYRVGLYTSPHIKDIRERISGIASPLSDADFEPISSAEFDALAQKWAPVIREAQRDQQGKLSHFEVLTGLAFSYFAASQVEIAVVETGVGGTLDATNVFKPEQHQLAVITALGLEHQHLLGHKIQEIAAAKAGICREGQPCVIGPQSDEKTLSTLWEAVTSTGANCLLGNDIAQVSSGYVTIYQDTISQSFQASACPPQDLQEINASPAERLHDDFSFDWSSKLIGIHQAGNAETAIAAALTLQKAGWDCITIETIKKGMENVNLPGRFQVLKSKAGYWMVLDGAHTSASADAVCKTMAEAFPDRPVALIVAMADDKDHSGVMIALRKLRPFLVVFTSVPIAGSVDRSAPPGMLTGHWQAANFHDEKPFRCRELIQANMASAIQVCERELAASQQEGLICVTGSLHAVAAALKVVES